MMRNVYNMSSKNVRKFIMENQYENLLVGKLLGKNIYTVKYIQYELQKISKTVSHTRRQTTFEKQITLRKTFTKKLYCTMTQHFQDS